MYVVRGGRRYEVRGCGARGSASLEIACVPPRCARPYRDDGGVWAVAARSVSESGVGSALFWRFSFAAVVCCADQLMNSLAPHVRHVKTGRAGFDRLCVVRPSASARAARRAAGTELDCVAILCITVLALLMRSI